MPQLKSLLGSVCPLICVSFCLDQLTWDAILIIHFCRMEINYCAWDSKHIWQQCRLDGPPCQHFRDSDSGVICCFAKPRPPKGSKIEKLKNWHVSVHGPTPAPLWMHPWISRYLFQNPGGFWVCFSCNHLKLWVLFLVPNLPSYSRWHHSPLLPKSFQMSPPEGDDSAGSTPFALSPGSAIGFIILQWDCLCNCHNMVSPRG